MESFQFAVTVLRYRTYNILAVDPIMKGMQSMKQLPKDLDEMFNSPEAANLLKNKEALLNLCNSQDAQQLIQLLKQTSGGSLQSAADAAMKGDPSELSKLVNDLTQTPEGAKAVSNLSRNLPR